VREAVEELTAEYREAEGLRRAKRELRKRRSEVPRAPTPDEIAAATATVPDYPAFTVSKKHFYAQFCKCMRYLVASKCDCQICAYVNWNTRTWHAARGKWDAKDRCAPGTCEACTPGSAYRRASSSPDEFMAFLLCQKVRPCDIQPTGFPPKPAAPCEATARTEQPAGAVSLALPTPDPRELRLKDAPKQFMVHAPACVYGRHIHYQPGKFVEPKPPTPPIPHP
jgi:hypothetical protein